MDRKEYFKRVKEMYGDKSMLYKFGLFLKKLERRKKVKRGLKENANSKDNRQR